VIRNRVQPSLDIDRLVSAAFEQLEDVGLDGLTMRRLASRLGVQAPALYWHVGDKAELLGAMARDIYASAYAAVPSAETWPEWLKLFGLTLRRSYAAHRDGALLCATARPTSQANPLEHANHIAAPLEALGLDRAKAISFQASVISYTIGWAIFEANGPMHDYLGHMMDFDESFASGLDALVAGFGEPS
jgi:TetR/AcrR family transcriptional regulator, tetracycline repressor protein